MTKRIKSALTLLKYHLRCIPPGGYGGIPGGGMGGGGIPEPGGPIPPGGGTGGGGN